MAGIGRVEGAMRTDRKRAVVSGLREILLKMAYELEAAALAARGAALALEDRQTALRDINQLYTRLQEADYLLSRFKSTVDETVAKASA
ncbi:MAG: hypothetical protein ACOCVR_04865 [Myxococcota bacterium]